MPPVSSQPIWSHEHYRWHLCAQGEHAMDAWHARLALAIRARHGIARDYDTGPKGWIARRCT
eukprot:6497709-Alexandrium_andersonii.AAC.1